MDRERARALNRVPHGSSDDPEVVDFSANTNPRSPEGTEDAYRAAFADASRYPAEPPEAYREAAAAYVDRDRGDGADPVTPDQVVPTPGGLAAMRLAIALAVDPGDTVVVPAPSFGEYAREVRLQGGEPVFVDSESILDSDPTGHAMAIVCNPNNPTGRAYDHGALLGYAGRCREAGARLLVDEAFLGFTDRPSMAGEDGVIVARSLTKLFGLPGIRAGFAVATGDPLSELRGGRRAWNVGAPALAVGAHCMDQREFVRTTRERVRSERERVAAALQPHYDVADSDAPFLLLDAGDRPVDSVLEAAAGAGIALRDARTFRGLDNHVRVAVRGADDNDLLIEVLRDV